MDKIQKIYNKSFPKYLREPFQIIKRKLSNNSLDIDIYVMSNEIIGFILYTPIISYYHVLVNYFCISPKFQGKGFGKTILTMFLEKFKNYTIILDCEKHLIQFYEKFGFSTYKLVHFPQYDTTIMHNKPFQMSVMRFFYPML